MANHALAQAALRGLTDPAKPRKNNLCQKYTRLCIQDVYGDRYDRIIWKPSAIEAGRALLAAGLAFRASEVDEHDGLQAGDVLYKLHGSGGYGHVGIYTPRGVAENATTHWNRSGGTDARGIRTLREFGRFDCVARFRLLTEAPKPPVQEPEKPVAQGIIIVRKVGAEWKAQRLNTAKNGADNWGKVRDVLAAAGVEIEKESLWGDSTPALFLKG